MKNRKIKFIASGIKWWDKVNGNTYHSVQITRMRDGAVLYCQFQYGYGDQWHWTAMQAMAKAKWLPVKYRGDNYYSYERENNYPVHWEVSHGLKRECVAHGEE